MIKSSKTVTHKSNHVESVRAEVVGMHCASCAATVKRVLEKVPGVAAVSVNSVTEKADITHHDGMPKESELNAALKKYGYSVHLPKQEHDHDSLAESEHEMNHADHQHEGHHQEVSNLSLVQWSLPVALGVFASMLWDMAHQMVPWFPAFPLPMMVLEPVLFFFATIFILSLGRMYFGAVLRFVQTGHANMDSLVGIGTGVAYAFSTVLFLFPSLRQSWGFGQGLYFDVTIVVLAFITAGKYLESQSKKKTTAALRALASLQVKTALVRRDDVFVELPVEQLVVGDVIQVKPGSKVPIDAVVLEGSSALDESLLTGESVPAEKNPGDHVIGGALNTYGSLLCRVEKVGGDTVLSQMLRLVEDAQSSKAPIEQLVDQVAAVFVPAVLVVALASALFWLAIGWFPGTVPGFPSLTFLESLRFALMSFVGVLVLACPCALGLATPTAVVTVVGTAARRGILLKSAEVLELLPKMQTLIVDKTGTLTQGKLSVVGTQVLDASITESQLIQYAASLEHHSEHPIGQAVVQASQEQSLPLVSVQNFRALPGFGITGTRKKVEYWIGSSTFLKESGHTIKESTLVQDQFRAATPIFLFTKDAVLGIIFVADTIRSESAPLVARLSRLGVQVVMATGDVNNAAREIAQQVGITEVRAQLRPDQKDDLVQEYQKQGRVVAMAGDGVNDAAALTRADIGISLSMGSDAAIAAAGVVLLHGDIGKIVEAFELAVKARGIIRQNLVWAFLYNVIGIPLAMGLFYPFTGTLLNPAFAGLAMALSSVSVVLNSLRLRNATVFQRG